MSIFTKIKKIFNIGKSTLPHQTILEFEEALIRADASLLTIKDIITPDLQHLQTSDAVKEKISARMLAILKPMQRKLTISDNIPFVIFVSGVNGSGKTTVIAKLANRFVLEGKKVLIGACDTFRAAAVEQLEYWAKQTGASIEKPLKTNEDPSAVAYRALKRAKDENFHILIIDTSGRLQTNKALMEELRKIQTVLKKVDESKPDLSLLVLDGSAGQNVISQGKEFGSFVKIDGVIMTKLDSSSRGGTLLTVASDLKLGIYLISLGEGLDDFSDFIPEDFVKNIFDSNV